jgi:short-subunit dehydrogenase
MRLAESVFVITGASSGIGRAVARALAAERARVALVARRRDRLDAIATELGDLAVAIACDITTGEAPELIATTTEQAFGRIDGLINCAGRGLAGKLVTLDVDSVDEALELNLIAPLRLIQRLAPAMMARGDGVIVNVSSPTADMGLPSIGGYALSKAALNAVTRTLRRELLTHGVRVLSVSPGVTESEFYDVLIGGAPDDRAERPPAQPAEAVARAIVDALRRDRREIWPATAAERRRRRVLGIIAWLFPRMVDRGLAAR